MFHVGGLAAERGINFENVQCPKPVCTPSRVAFLTGRRVAELSGKDYYSDFNDDFETFPGR